MKTSSCMATSLSMQSVFSKKNSPVRSANYQFAQVITEGDKSSFPIIIPYERKFEMKYIVTVTARQTQYLSSRTVVEIKDGISPQELYRLLNSSDYESEFKDVVDWEMVDQDYPEDFDVESVEEDEDSDYKTELCFVLTEDGSLVLGDVIDGEAD